MVGESTLKEKLRKIEALFAGAATAGERAAAGAAADRIRARLRESEGRERALEMRFSLADPWSRRLFIALCRRYGLRPFRYPRMHRQSVVVKVPQSFLDQVLWPEFAGDQRRPQRISGRNHRRGDPRRGLPGGRRGRGGGGAGAAGAVGVNTSLIFTA